ncbi:hypothetical protein HanPSC8_Chr01g0044441 [Helianthus annuus]|nr:hypothetical protein HanIR_Chr01g0049831 [Helianthus annuus]KAJ0958940.1 hypothetical protein HanPSC8_Chr01g0044441 [Helianthus annuus]
MNKSPSFGPILKSSQSMPRDDYTRGNDEQAPEHDAIRPLNVSRPPYATETARSTSLMSENLVRKRPSHPHALLLQQKDEEGQSENSYNKTLNPYEIETRIEERVISTVNSYIEAIRTEMSKMEERIHQMQETLNDFSQSNKTKNGSKGIFGLLRSKI